MAFGRSIHGRDCDPYANGMKESTGGSWEESIRASDSDRKRLAQRRLFSASPRPSEPGPIGLIARHAPAERCIGSRLGLTAVRDDVRICWISDIPLRNRSMRGRRRFHSEGSARGRCELAMARGALVVPTKRRHALGRSSWPSGQSCARRSALHLFVRYHRLRVNGRRGR